MRKKYLVLNLGKVLCIIPYVLVLSLSKILLAEPMDAVLSTLLWEDIFGRISGDGISSFVMSAECLGMMFVFALLFGNEISLHLGNLGIFVFTRIKSRRAWAVRNMAGLGILSMLYTGVFVIEKFLITLRSVESWNFDCDTVWTLFALFGVLCPLLAMIGITVNWISVRHGTMVGVFSVFVAVVVLRLIAVMFYSNPVNMVCNPLCFPIEITSKASSALAKIGVDILYLLLISGGFAFYIENMDIMGKGDI